MDITKRNASKLLLHACCGPCSLEPSRILAKRGEAFDIFYNNPNIAPLEEYEKRLDTLKSWASSENLQVLEGPNDHAEWVSKCRRPFENGEIDRQTRCRLCYRMRFEETARVAKDEGYRGICTTLSVSPYQYTEVIHEELKSACERAGLECAFEDFRPYYNEATARSRKAGMYRQNYCGCEISIAEAEEERQERRRRRKVEQERKRARNEERREKEKSVLEDKKKARKLYDEERSRRKKILREMRSDR